MVIPQPIILFYGCPPQDVLIHITQKTTKKMTLKIISSIYPQTTAIKATLFIIDLERYTPAFPDTNALWSSEAF